MAMVVQVAGHRAAVAPLRVHRGRDDLRPGGEGDAHDRARTGCLFSRRPDTPAFNIVDNWFFEPWVGGRGVMYADEV
jgi:hypothetical protein